MALETTKVRKLTVRFYRGHDGYIVAECLEIPGCMSQGKTIGAAKRNIADAIDACLEVMRNK